MTVELREVTAATVRAICRLDVTDEQRSYVASVAVSIAEAHFAPKSTFRAIYADEEPVGFMLWRDGDRPKSAYLWRLMIDKAHQKKGYARLAIEHVFTELKAQGFDTLTTSVVRGEHSALCFYREVGFVETHKISHGGEWVLRKGL